MDVPHEWREGQKGFERRIANAYAGHAVNSTLQSRLEYALESTVQTRVPDSGGGYRRFPRRRQGGQSESKQNRVCALPYLHQ